MIFVIRKYRFKENGILSKKTKKFLPEKKVTMWKSCQTYFGTIYLKFLFFYP